MDKSDQRICVAAWMGSGCGADDGAQWRRRRAWGLAIGGPAKSLTSCDAGDWEEGDRKDMIDSFQGLLEYFLCNWGERVGGLTCKKAKTPLDSYRANVEHCLHACTDCLLAPQTFPLLKGPDDVCIPFKSRGCWTIYTLQAQFLRCRASGLTNASNGVIPIIDFRNQL